MTNKIKVLIGVNLLLALAIGFSFFTFSTSTKTDGEAFFNLEDLSQLSKFVIDGHEIVKEDDGRWIMDGTIDIAPRKMGMLFQALQKVQTIEEKEGMPSAGKEIVIYIAGAPIFTGTIASESDAVSYGKKQGQVYSIEIPGQFVAIEEIFTPSSSEWRDKTLFRTSWRTLKKWSVVYNNNPENNIEITFKDPFYDVKGITELDSAAVYQYVTSLPRIQALYIENRASFVEDTVSKFRPFCQVKMEDLVTAYNTEVNIYPFDNKVFAYLPKTKEVTEIDPKNVQNLLVSWHFFDANDPRKKAQK
ncbi:hypothetical protein EI427_03400 [Flammeovirga pectinis]|uniref:DUF4340 domain-containing protein n=1 Tax=Flammeovirga pectinis TaxID=2494373 RepID=A0A3S9NZE7_9BACT|nr:hypothetical protein [Flammeovirga pectinis]AZQ61301.1 hypothetical protein EI427_03400 [Flammeovirga pectinis]